MTYEPTRDVPPAPDLAPTAPMPVREAREGSMLLPIIIIAALVVGALYYFFGDSIAPGPNVRADSGVTTSSKSPN